MTHDDEKKQIDNRLLDLIQEGSQYSIMYDSCSLTTPEGAPVSHHNHRLINFILLDLTITGHYNPDSFTGYAYFCRETKVDVANSDIFQTNIEEILERDVYLNYWLSNNRNTYSPADILPSDHYLDHPELLTLVLNISGVLQKSIHHFFDDQGITSSKKQDISPASLKNDLIGFYGQLIPSKRAVINQLFHHYPCGYALPVLLLEKYITPGEFASGLFHCECLSRPNQHVNMKDRSEFVGFFQKKIALLKEIAQSMLEYCSFPEASIQEELRMKSLIAKGEGDNLEFKSTLRWNIKESKKDPAIEHACLKTICAFLNATGGTLLIGVSDDGAIPGIENDAFENTDKFLIHLWNLIKSQIGEEFSNLIYTCLESADEKTVCLVRCLPARTPVFLVQKGLEDEFFIRTGPSTTRLGVADAYKYIKERFPR